VLTSSVRFPRSSMLLCVYEDESAAHLAPLTLTRAQQSLHLGLGTVAEGLGRSFGRAVEAFETRPEVAALAALAHPGVPVNARPDGADVLAVSAAAFSLAPPLLGRLAAAAREGTARAFVQDGSVVAAFLPGARAAVPLATLASEASAETVEGAVLVRRLWDVAPQAAAFVEADVVRYRPVSAPEAAQVHPSAVLVAPERIVIGAGVRIRAGAVVTAEDGPVVLLEGADVGEHAVVRGPCVIGGGSTVKAMATVEEAVVGPGCKVGGEVHTSVFLGRANKAHAGFLGHSVIGPWCNLGASTDTSNLRNDYGEVSMYDAVEGDFAATGRQFLGLVLGDHSKCSIGTTFNTGTVVGVGCNLYGAGFHDRHVPSFSWGEPGAYVPYRFDKFARVAEAVLARRNLTLHPDERAHLERLSQSPHALQG
jgi:UDP-N-acetylglucosamine diphosphorylase / glucose-1-phosphate thymidylyltransferase / UDP-N-acetylgalactosamine diphosphorylase / glucosamine-1-phosphate N-acetyltransferase / galactosamine-1-phosphate N-acetyltransferase